MNIWFENERNRFRRHSSVDPWNSYDGFRVNHIYRRPYKLQEGEDTVHDIKIEYLSESKFNVYDADDKLILQNAEVILNQEREEEILIRTDTE